MTGGDTTLSIQFEGSSCEMSQANNDDEQTLEDQGENSTTLSSIQEVTVTPEKDKDKQLAAQEKKDIEFKELLENLDIENIEISTSS